MKDIIVSTLRSIRCKAGSKVAKEIFSISCASVDWGIPVPNDNKQTIYVCFDALLGYVSALSEDAGQANLQSAISSGWPASLLFDWKGSTSVSGMWLVVSCAL
ncbi:methionine--tRNA ligase, chloroplastic/mitochondrial-like isoform X2 [Castanea sativa]|uniref:methionine--tRNA ligase, chloroplastic/mitochondrial-like isoform X2 n=1 Tax=Castanea sativa TaxID=21020 RepID=UPI003F64C8F4